MTPVTAFYAGILGIVFLYLSILVIQQRITLKVSLGDDGDSHLLGVIRAHGNFAEYVPLILVLLFLAETNGINAYLVHFIGVCLVSGRVLHAYGLRHHTGVSWQRKWGVILTFLALLCSSILSLLVVFN